jgi:diaminopimelate epimerase
MPSRHNSRIPFFKMTGSGNDFILIDNRKLGMNADDSRGLVQRACRRKLSVGADGLIFIEDDPEVDFRWRFFNADGSEAEMCGNGARCAARYAYLKGIVDRPAMSFRTLAGVVKAELLGERVKVMMPRPHSLETGLQLQVEGRFFELAFINTGVPHVVIFARDREGLEREDVFRWGRALRYHPRFQPAGTNVNFVVAEDSHHMVIRTYERGVEGETLACGTGSIASALAAAAKGLTQSPVDLLTRSQEVLKVHFRELFNRDKVELDEVFLEGDARVAYEAELWDETVRE